MAWALILTVLSSAITAVAAFASPHIPPNGESIISLNRGSNSSTAMFLPLYFNNPDQDRRHKEGFYNRRHLRGRSALSARMPLHDDLLLNGYYTARLWIGTPPQRFALIVDTGSTVTYVPCSTCKQCGKHQDPRFKPDLSSTYHPVKCNIDCPCDNAREQCVYERQYAEMSSSSGVLGEDIVSFGNQSELEPQRAVFGCENMETGDLYSQHADGIMGLGRGDLSIVDQLVEKGVITDSFSLCYGGMDVGGGAMVLGGISLPDDMVFTRSDPVRSPYYNIELREIHVAGKMLSLSPRIFDGKHGTVLDSGTTYAYFPEMAFKAFKDAILKELHSLKRIQGPDPNYNDICFSGAGSDVSQLSNVFPSVEMVFDHGQKLLLSPENYLFRHSKVHGAYCLGIFQNGKDPTTLLGGIIVRNTLVTYDRGHESIGFWKTNCSELWERLHLSSVPPPPPPFGTDETNSTMAVSPSLAPTEPPLQIAPGEIKIGLITFYMLLTVKYPELKPHISELANVIAKELGVNASQVQLMNVTSTENNTLIRWAVLPGASVEFISNATATDIISRLNGNNIHLPDTFGSYKLFEWKIEPPPERTWLQQHYLVIVGASVVVIVAGLLASGAWVIWRRKRSVLAYETIDSAVTEQELHVAEQELQPLQN
ncbi:Eukaryotic aspartyl protease family protein [Striga hermonthica]|uniref:Eukaryotic aspartyl protease family protein n=1 Tax=Striga hermonthica TaxID=68872 RepID=A0A9N7NK92_STRHE|nr:Eukaryotic aspartyl protease family protein [Striga hermonthica]